MVTVINNYNIRTITFKLCELLLVSHTTNKIKIITIKICVVIIIVSMNVGPCHHGMARPRVADGGTASNMEGSCE
jgi:hypothetical protein